ncbi:MAG: HD domain-containing protein [bacterium]|nr:MAG: HD domain-containing protein [bacterium]
MTTAGKLSKIIDLGLEMNQVKDLDILLDRILSEARKFVNADAGSIYIRRRDKLEFSYTQNATLQKSLPPGKKLIYSSFTVPINNLSIAGYVAGNGVLLNIQDAYRLPEDAPYSFSHDFDKMSKYRTQSILTIPLTTKRNEVIGVLQLINAKNRKGEVVAFQKSMEPMILHFASIAANAIERANMTRSIILRTIEMARLRDPKETGAHVQRVASYSVAIYEVWAMQRSIPPRDVERDKDILKIAAMLHDVGKVAIPDIILKKPDKLNDREFETMKQHTWLGAKLFSETFSEYDEASAIIAMNHHERWDGSGYPGFIDPETGRPILGFEVSPGKARGRKSEEIPPFGRIVAIADVYDALSSSRSYKDAWDEDRILETMRMEAGRHFDPEMIDAFFFSLDVVHNIKERIPDTD